MGITTQSPSNLPKVALWVHEASWGRERCSLLSCQPSMPPDDGWHAGMSSHILLEDSDC